MMDAKTLEALHASIAKWERNAEAKTPGDFTTRADDCPLCDLFLYRRANCRGCPVSKRAGEKLCKGTPYIAAHFAGHAWRREGDTEAAARAHAAARDEVAFLKSLLPVQTEALCSDCPPIGYPTDITRCSPCPRRADGGSTP